MSHTQTWTRGLLGGLCGAVLLGILSLSGCGHGATGTVAEYYGHYHPANWINDHQAAAAASTATCKTCHEISLIKAGNGIPNCLTSACHHGSTPGWANADLHGARAKWGVGTPGGSLVACQICHGKDFSGGASAQSCATCHGVPAPHPAKPWRAAAGSLHTHTTTDPSNAAVCAQCHYPGSPVNPAGHPATPAPAGTTPGCFNNTMCHGNAGAPHALGPIWTDPTSNAFHGLQAKQDLNYCQGCHGTPGTPKFDGGSASTACSSCHTAAGAHPTTWYQAPVATFPGYVQSHRNAGNFTACNDCHDGLVKGRTAPLPAAPSCFSASYANSEHAAVGCHANGPGVAPHPIPFIGVDHTTVTQAQFDGNCAACHAVSGTSPISAAPTCSVCHQAASPLAAGSGPGTCLSCHSGPSGLPAGPTGTAFPSLAGAHAKHMGLLTKLTCDTCHNGIGTGSLTHYDAANARAGQPTGPAPVAIAATFNAQSGSAGFTPATLTCSNVSCHGGKVTPNWQTGTLSGTNAATCTSCHQVRTGSTTSPQYNDATGRHSNPSNHNTACSTCHNMALTAAGAKNHFKYLDTQAVSGAVTGTPADQFPSDTIAFDPAVVTGARTYTVTAATQGKGGCALTCHGQDHSTSGNTWN
jgi:predicted CxxxxCH...CXXCH cytochrome family protein